MIRRDFSLLSLKDRIQFTYLKKIVESSTKEVSRLQQKLEVAEKV